MKKIRGNRAVCLMPWITRLRQGGTEKADRKWRYLLVCACTLMLGACPALTAQAAGEATGNTAYTGGYQGERTRQYSAPKPPKTAKNAMSARSVTSGCGASSATEYAYVAVPGWTEGTLWWNCTSDYCAINSFVPSGGGNFGCWQGAPLPLGHYYWLGSINVLECVDGIWTKAIASTSSYYFNYDPRSGDQSAVAGGECGASPPSPETPNPDPGKPECPPVPLN